MWTRPDYSGSGVHSPDGSINPPPAWSRADTKSQQPIPVAGFSFCRGGDYGRAEAYSRADRDRAS